MRRLSPFIIPLVIILVLDQLTKQWALATFWRAASPPHELIIVPGWLVFTPVENRGVAFGLFRGYGHILALVVVVFLTLMAIRHWRDLLAATPAVKVFAGLIAGGGIGNLIDRAYLSFVVDFIRIPALPIFQVFNIADAAISLGGVLLVLTMWRQEHSGAVGRRPGETPDLEQPRVEAENH